MGIVAVFWDSERPNNPIPPRYIARWRAGDGHPVTHARRRPQQLLRRGGGAKAAED